MKRFLTRFFAVLISVCVAASSFTVSAFAFAEAAFYTVGSLIFGAIVNWIADGGAEFIAEGLAEFGENCEDAKGRVNALNFSDDSIYCYYDDISNRYSFHVSNNSGLSDSDLEVAHFVCDYLNENFDIDESYDQGNAIFYYSGIGMNNYEKRCRANYVAELKTEVYNAMNGYFTKELYKDKLELTNLTASELEAALGGSFPRYNFDFVGPVPKLDMIMPTSTGIASLKKDGFVFSPVITSSMIDPNLYCDSEGLASYICDSISFLYSERHRLGGYNYRVREGNNVFGYTYYVLLDDGSLYFTSYSSYSPEGTIDSWWWSLTQAYRFISSGGCYFIDPSGNSSLFDIGNNFRLGLVFNVDNQVNSAYPQSVQTITESDFTVTTGGESISKVMPRTETENTIGGAIGVGLIAADAPLTIGEDGSITAADGIPIEKLDEILEKLRSGNLNLGSIEEYLSLISTLVGNGNLTATEQQQILENVNANTKASAKDLAQIRAAIEELTKEYEWEAEDEDTGGEISWITAEHTGFSEALQLTDEIEAVSQSKQLLNNLLNKFDSADNRAPNFSFYWDSDKDGELEEYTVLDLSFLEQKLTNSNLKDKRRFRSGNMTVRSFVQFLIILVFYSSFAIKIIKRIPSLINGAGGSDSDIHTVSKEK